ncbi:MAG: CPBP family intramembrane glutamic endopeptidase [Pseudomonadota bacterium]
MTDFEFLRPHAEKPASRLFLFFGLTFLITWGLAALLLIAPDFVDSVGGPDPQDPYASWLYYIAVYGPTLAALILLLVFQGPRGILQLGRDALAPGRPLSWVSWIALGYLILPIGWILFDHVGKAIGQEALFGTTSLRGLFWTAPVTLATTNYLLMDPGPVGEEPGWRGYAMPRLLLVMHPILAGALLGAIWGVWHLPAFLAAGSSQSEDGLNFFWFCLSLTSQGVMMTWIYLRSRGNWFAAGLLPHAAVNVSSSIGAFANTGLMYPLAPVLWAVLICGLDPVMRQRIRLTGVS